MKYVFPGMKSFFDAVVRSRADVDSNFISYVERLEAISRVGKALSQAGLARPEDRPAICLEAFVWREVLEFTLEVVESAIAEACSEMELGVPEFLMRRGREGLGGTAGGDARNVEDASIRVEIDPEDVETYLPPPRTRKK